MYAGSHRALDERLAHTLDGVGLVGQRFRESLIHDLKSKIVLRDARDPVAVTGPPGSGKHKVVEAAHAVACGVLGRSGPRVDFDCGATRVDAFEPELRGAMGDAAGGTLVLDRFGTLDENQRRSATRIIDRQRCDALVLTVRRTSALPADAPRPARTTIRVKPLHEREDDIWELIDHFFGATASDCGDELLRDCRGFSRQAKADIAEAIRETNLASVRRLRDVVRDVVFEVLAEDELPLKVTSEQVRPYLEANFGQTDEDREDRDAALIESQFDSLVQRSLVERFAEVHDVPPELIQRQAELLEELVGYIEDVPRSYRNIMDRAEDIQRAALWVVSGATTQAEFRRFFGAERFMRPTKSVAWAFYNRVFKRDM